MNDPAQAAAPVPRGPALAAALGGIILLWSLLYLPGLGGEELKGEEPRRALPGLAMVRSGDWVHPRVGGEDYHRKPPLVNWLCAAGTLASGRVDEFSVRWPTTVLVLALGLALALGVGRAAGPEAGFLAAVFALTNIGLLEKGRLAEIEGAYVALTGIAFAAWFGWVGGVPAARRRPWRGWAVSGLFLGLAFLAKGPPHLVMFYAVVVAVLGRGHRWRDLWHPAHFLGLALAVAVALPWFLASAAAPPAAGGGAGGTAPAAAWWDQIRTRLDFTSIDWPSWALQILQGVANFLPWALLLVPLCLPPLRRRWQVDDPQRLVPGLVLGVVAGYFLIALTPASHGRFTMPLTGPASALVAVALCQGTSWTALARPWRRTLIVLCYLVAAAGAGCLAWAARQAAVPLPWLALGGSWLACLLAWRLAHRAGHWPLAAASGVLCVAVLVLYVQVAQPFKAGRENIRPIARAVGETLLPGETAVVYRGGIQPWVFYLWGRVVEVASRDDLPRPLPGPLVLRRAQWVKELEKLEQRYGSVDRIVPVENLWDPAKPLVVVRFSGR